MRLGCMLLPPVASPVVQKKGFRYLQGVNIFLSIADKFYEFY